MDQYTFQATQAKSEESEMNIYVTDKLNPSCW